MIAETGSVIVNRTALLTLFLVQSGSRSNHRGLALMNGLPEENENIIIMCEHGAIFNGTYCNGVWFCMDGYIHDIYKSNPIYSSMSSIPSLWEPVAWMPIPSFDDILEANRDVLERIKDKGD